MELSTKYGDIPLRYRAGDGRGLCILYPGLHYGLERPYLYLSAKAALYLGYDVLEVPYPLASIPPRMRGPYLIEVARGTLRWAEERSERLLLVGMAAGTLVLTVSEEETQRPTARVWLSPLLNQSRVQKALARERRGLVVLGGEDPYADSSELRRILHEGLELFIVPGANRWLELDDPVPTVEGLKSYLESLMPYVQAVLG